jgi:hypothetical protein
LEVYIVYFQMLALAALAGSVGSAKNGPKITPSEGAFVPGMSIILAQEVER